MIQVGLDQGTWDSIFLVLFEGFHKYPAEEPY